MDNEEIIEQKRKTVEELDTENPEEGIYFDVPDSKYFETNALNNTKLGLLREQTPLHVKYRMEHPEEFNTSSSAQYLGTLVHKAILEPEEYEQSQLDLPDHSKNSNIFYEKLQDWYPEADLDSDKKWAENLEKLFEAYPDKILAKKKDKELADSMAEAASNCSRLNRILESGAAEVVIIWEDEETGIMCKAKLDWLNWQNGVVLDVKKTRDASVQGFGKSVGNYGYYRQLPWYNRGCKALGLQIGALVFFAIEDEPPYAYAFHQLKPDDWQLGENEIDYFKKIFALCKEHDYWYGYREFKPQTQQFTNVLTPDIPKYVYYQSEKATGSWMDAEMPFAGKDPIEDLEQKREEHGGVDPDMEHPKYKSESKATEEITNE